MGFVVNYCGKLAKYDNMTRVAGKEPDTGPTSRTVARNVRRLREAKNLNFSQLSDRLAAAADWSINAVGIRRIESGERRVTPDDLTALAIAFDVSPITLLMPAGVDPSTPVEVTGVDGPVAAGDLWRWLCAAYPIDTMPPLTFFANALPAWDRDPIEQTLRKLTEGRTTRGQADGDR